jgi:hypothetical protein
MNPTPLTHDEKADFARLEQQIQKGRQAFRSVALALREIRDRLLYRADYATFDDYCRERFNFGKWHGGELAAAGWIIVLCEAEGLPAPENLKQARNIRRFLRIPRPKGRPSEAKDDDPKPIPERLAKLRDFLRTHSYKKLKPRAPLPAGYPVEAKVKQHLQVLRVITDLHPWKDKANELLDRYAATVFPWRTNA